MTMNQPLQSLRDYVRDCRFLRRDFKQALEYWEFRASGGAIGLAVDFSEIHAFLLPGTDDNHLAIFGSSDDKSAALFDRAVLRQLFEPSDFKVVATDGKLVLMDPYAIEFDGFLHWLKVSEFSRYAGLAMDVFEEARQALELPEFKLLSDLLQEAKTKERILSSEETANLLSFLERHAPSLFAFTTESYQDPLLNARRLLLSGIFKSLKDFADVNEPESEIYDRWYAVLPGERIENKQVQSGMDAMAISLLAQANRILPSNKRLYLVTRSSVMHSIFEREYNNNLWSDYGYVLLHPRVFSILFSVAHKTHEAARADLVGRLENIELFLAAMAPDGIYREADIDEPEYVRTWREDIQRDWKATESLAVSLPDVRALTSGANVPTLPVLLRMVDLLKDREALVQLVSARLDELAVEIESEHDVLSLYYRSHGTREKQALQRLRADIDTQYRIDAASVPDTVWVLGTSSHAMPYKLHFYTAEAGDVLTALTTEQSWQRVFEVLRRSWTTETEYELPLIVGYVSAVLNRWRLAGRYAQRALDVADRLGTVARHEALFFYAITLRKSETSDKVPRHKHIESLEYLRRAIAAEQVWLGDHLYSDPRYLKELGTQILRLNTYFQRSNEYPPPEEGLNHLAEALAVCKDDQLRVQILNSRVFYLIESGVSRDLELLRNEWNKLLRLQEDIELDESEWPPAVLDTLAWGEWVVNNKQLGPEQYLSVRRRLELASKCNDCSPEERRQIREHLIRFYRDQRQRL